LGPAAARAVPELLDMLKVEGVPYYRARVVEVIGQVGPAAAKAVPALLPLLEDPDPGVRQAAAVALWRVDQKRKAKVLPVLVEAVRGASSYPQLGVFQTLAQIGPEAKEALPALRLALASQSPLVRLEAAVAVWRIEGKAEGVVPVLVSLLDEIYFLSVVGQAAEALGEMGEAARAAVPK